MRYIPVILIFLLCFTVGANSQEPAVTEKSDIIETIDGKKYYLHFVDQGQTLFSIARIYDIDVKTIFLHNPEAREGIKTGQLLKIPYPVKGVSFGEKMQSDDESGFFYHIVKPKETLFGLSKQYSVTIPAIREMNPGMGEYPKAGDVIKIPQTDTDRPAEKSDENYLTHIVSSGETLYSLANQYGVTIGQIRNANPENSDTLRIGQQLYIPKPLANEQDPDSAAMEKSPGIIEYTVMPGETLYRIAADFAVSIDTLMKLNPSLSEGLKAEEIIRIPVRNEPRDYIMHYPSEKEKVDDVAEKYGIDPRKLKDINPDLRRKVRPGDAVKIPVKEPVLPEPDTLTMEPPGKKDLLSDPCNETDKHAERTYNVALMLPFSLEYADSIMDTKTEAAEIISTRPFRFIQFYEGFLLAADSAAKKGMKLNLFVYDANNNPASTHKILQSSELVSMDLIIGPVYSNEFEAVRSLASAFGIKMVNPFSSRKEILEGKGTVFRIIPAEESQVKILSSYISRNYPYSNVIVLRHNKYKYADESYRLKTMLNTTRRIGLYLGNQVLIEKTEGKDQLFTENKLIKTSYLRENPLDSVYFSNTVKEVIYSGDSLPGLRLSLSAFRHNFVVIMSDDKVFSHEVISRMNKLAMDYEITVAGIPNWEEFEDLETEYLMNLQLHTLNHSFIDYNDPEVIRFIRKFRNSYHTEPIEQRYAFEGFDIGWYFLNALRIYGNNFERCLTEFDPDLLHTRFRFMPRGNGFENQYWNLIKYEDHSRLRVDWK